MFRRNQNSLVLFFLAVGCGFSLYYMTVRSVGSNRSPAAAGDWTQADYDRATLAVSMSEFQESRPKVGRSYFDMIFSEETAGKTAYQIPYPFNKIIGKLENYVGQKANADDAGGVKVTIFPMGRSLQRNAAVAGLNQAFSFDPFYRYPRVVIGVDGEPTHENSLLLNLKNKIYVGFNERAEILESISYNDEEGRYEYQIVRDYAPGKTPKVSYANRSLCLSCHQNQTPIFSRGPWSESNANKVVSDFLKKKMDSSFPKTECDGSQSQPYCYKGSMSYYYGAPVAINESVPYRLDVSTDQGNLIHAYQKMWKELCTSNECKIASLKNLILYRLNGSSGLIGTEDQLQWLKGIDNAWRAKWPNGLSIPSPNVPNRDPMKDISDVSSGTSFTTVSSQAKKSVQDLLAQSKIPTEFEPLLPRQPIDIWKDSGADVTNTNRLIRGLSQEFTLSDMKMVDNWLLANRGAAPPLTVLSADCSVDPDGKNIAISCASSGAESFELNAYFLAQDSGAAGDVSDFSIRSDKMKCDPSISQSEMNKFSGKSCPRMTDLKGTFRSDGTVAQIFLRRPDGISIRTLHGYSIAEVSLQLATKKALIKVYDQSAIVRDVLAKNTNELFRFTSFSRFQVMKVLTQYAQLKMNKMQNSNMNGLEMVVDGETSAAPIEGNATGLGIMKNVCARCHANQEGVPPNFMGLPASALSDVDLCRRIEQCAPRMIYRLKMRKCDKTVLQRKKNPMPPDFFLSNNKIAVSEWMNVHNAKILSYLNSLSNETDLAQDLLSHGMTPEDARKASHDILQSECPESNSVIYDQLPKCEFNQLKPVTKCR